MNQSSKCEKCEKCECCGDSFAVSALNQSTIAQSNQQALVVIAVQSNCAHVSQIAIGTNKEEETINS